MNSGTFFVRFAIGKAPFRAGMFAGEGAFFMERYFSRNSCYNSLVKIDSHHGQKMS